MKPAAQLVDGSASGYAGAARNGAAPSPPAQERSPLERNIDALMSRRARELEAAPLSERVAAAVTGFLGSMWSVMAHAAIFGTWIFVNLGFAPGVEPWDPTFVVLGMIASVEAIFLTTFVLINQNRLSRTEEERNELAVQLQLLSEQRTSKLVGLLADIARRMDVPVPGGDEVEELRQQASPDAIIDEIREQRPEPL